MKRSDDEIVNTWRFFIAAIILTITAPMIIQLLFKTSAITPFFAAEWTAGEILGYIGSLIGAASTICAVVLTIREERKGRREEQRLGVIPLIAITRLNRRIPQIDLFGNQPESVDISGMHEEDDETTYQEHELDREYIVIREDGSFQYLGKLSEEQKRLVSSGRWIQEQVGIGLFCEVENKSEYIPVKLYSSGKGPAVNMCVWMERDGYCPTYEGHIQHLSPKQMAVNESRYVGILFENVYASDVFGCYELVTRYEDVLGHHYIQRHQLCVENLGTKEDPSLKLSFDLKIDRQLVEESLIG